jgi:hypothetical protein
VALGSGRWCANTTAFPDVRMIETALAGGTVAREMICAGLSEHRTPVESTAGEFTKGCVRGAAGSENLPAESQGWHSGRKERLPANPQTMDRDSNRRCQLEPTQTTHETPNFQSLIQGRGWWALPPRPPEIYRFGTNPGETQQKRDADQRPVSGLGPWRGARVASPRGPVLRPGHRPCYPRSACGTTPGARVQRQLPLSLRGMATSPWASEDERNPCVGGPVPSRTVSSACVISDPGRSVPAVAPIL